MPIHRYKKNVETTPPFASVEEAAAKMQVSTSLIRGHLSYGKPNTVKGWVLKLDPESKDWNNLIEGGANAALFDPEPVQMVEPPVPKTPVESHPEPEPSEPTPPTFADMAEAVTSGDSPGVTIPDNDAEIDPDFFLTGTQRLAKRFKEKKNNSR